MKNHLIDKLPLSCKRKLEKAKRLVSGHLPKSLMPPYPSSVIIDPVNTCNLKCSLCPTGLGKLKYKPVMMSFKTFKIVVDKIPTLKHLCLFNWGEPFLNPEIFNMIGYANQINLKTTIHSNFSFMKDDEFFRNILDSKLHTLVISLDGASQHSYSKYRIGGNFDLVLSNIKKLAEMKKKLRSKDPDIIWKFIINRFNEKYITDAKNIADNEGIKFETAFMGLSDDLPGFDFEETLEQRKGHWLPLKKKNQHPFYRSEYSLPLNSSICTDLFQTIVINPDGKVFPCCWTTNREYTLGDLTKESLEEIWYNSKYLYSRSLFSNEKYSGPREKTVCSLCNNYKKIEKS